MSKFVYLTEKKRIARLQTIRSTFSHHQQQQSSQIQSQVLARGNRKDIRKSSSTRLLNNEFSFRDAIHSMQSEQTRTGLTLRLHPEIQGTKKSKITSPCNPPQSSLSISLRRQGIRSNPTETATTNVLKNTRGKENENQSHQGYKSKSKGTQEATEISSSKNHRCDTDQHSQGNSFIIPVNQPTSGSSRRTTTRHTSIRQGQDKKKTHPLHMGTQHISMSTLTKEHEEALALLKSLG